MTYVDIPALQCPPVPVSSRLGRITPADRSRCSALRRPYNLSSAFQPRILMPAQTILSKEEKAKVTSAIPKGSNKLWIASLARIYYAYPNPNEWSYAGLQGGLAFAKNSQGSLSFKLVDLDGTRGVIWEHELYQNFDYFQDRPYFHSFPGDVRLPPSFLCTRANLPMIGMYDWVRLRG